jgi:hypothetical protein
LAKAEQYRRYAAECLKLLSRVGDAHTRAMFSQMATAWVNLAEQAERNAEADLIYESLDPEPARPVVQQQQQQPKPDK